MLISSNWKLKLLLLTFKKETIKTEFLDLTNNPQHKIAFNEFPLGNHKLHLGKGRHTTPKTPVHQRSCSFCHSNEIEDDKHILFHCNFYDKFLLELNDKITSRYPCFNTFDNNSKISFLFNNVDPFIYRLISAFQFLE